MVFTEPQVAAVGHTLERPASGDGRARRRRRDRGQRRRELPRAQRAGHDAAGGRRATARVVGATFVGPEIAESLHAATIAVAGEVPIDRLWHAVPAFPTRSEVWLKLLEEYGL